MTKQEKRQIIIFASFCVFLFVFAVLAVCFIKPDSGKKEIKYTNISVDYEVVNLSKVS